MSDDEDFVLDIDEEDDEVEEEEEEVLEFDLDAGSEPDEEFTQEKPRKGSRAEKRIKQLIRDKKALERQLQEERNSNQNLSKRTVELEGKWNSSTEVAFSEHKNRLEVERQALEANLTSAFDEADTAKIAQLTSELSRNRAEEVRLNELEASRKRQASKPKDDPQPKPPQFSPRQQRWFAENKWFRTDKDMTVAALEIHHDMVENEGWDVRSSDYYDEIDRRIRKKFPEKFAGSKPKQNVSAPSRTGSGRGRRVTLTKEEIAQADRMGVPRQEWAKQKAKIMERDNA